MWQPSCSVEALQARAQLNDSIRRFFKERNVLEVETPLLCKRGTVDFAIDSIPGVPFKAAPPYFLQTSPEFAMKRLLSQGAPSIYQLGKAFRQGERGQFHNPEFTMLEWYRLGFSCNELMDEVDELLIMALNLPPSQRISYQALFIKYLNVNPFKIGKDAVFALLEQNNVVLYSTENLTLTDGLQLLMSHVIEPKLGFDMPCMVYDFPAAQAALAKISPTDPEKALRFEVYIEGIEIANGFEELQDAALQRERFMAENKLREKNNKIIMELDEDFLSALPSLPHCSGVALGVDRLLMLQMKAKIIDEVLAFPLNSSP